jgi:hypothetical protein
MTSNWICPECEAYNHPSRPKCWQCGKPFTTTNLTEGASTNQDSEYLKLLSIFHYVLAVITALAACFPVIHLIVGISLFFHYGNFVGGPEQFFALMFVIIPAILVLGGWAFAVCLFLAGRYLASRTRRLFCLVVAGISCAFAPFWTVLGVFTIIVLMRSSVKELFETTKQ